MDLSNMDFSDEGFKKHFDAFDALLSTVIKYGGDSADKPLECFTIAIMNMDKRIKELEAIIERKELQEQIDNYYNER